ncbi:hypothetical protein, partial [Streptomyces sp. AB3(2024)]|uniref:hypothetical protein n=1 Tax=Streptomyces sp. AB3(2024) TaxID=3317321 RepID=UPI0035A3B481
DEKLRFIRGCFKLYPWEWLAEDTFGPQVLDTYDHGGGSRPLVRGRGLAVLAGGLGSLLAWVAAFSPARRAVSALVGAARTDGVPLPLGSLASAVLLAAAAGTLACLVSARRE